MYGQTAIYPLKKNLIDASELIDPSVRELDQSRLGSILTGDARSATICAATPSIVYEIKGDAVHELLENIEKLLANS